MGALGAITPGPSGVAGLSLRGAVRLSKRVQLAAATGVWYSLSKEFSLRDSSVQLPIDLVSTPSLRFVLTPGVTLPTGSLSSSLRYTMISTGSVDPTLGASLLAGGGWMVGWNGYLRVPVYEGFDLLRQGIYGIATGRLIRRVGDGAVYAGLSAAGQTEPTVQTPGFVELAVIAGGSLPVSKRWAVDASVRIPVWAGDDPIQYVGALRLGVTFVAGK